MPTQRDPGDVNLGNVANQFFKASSSVETSTDLDLTYLQVYLSSPIKS